MRLFAKLALCASLPCVIGGVNAVSAQSSRQPGAPRLLSRDQGQALVDFALQHGRWNGRKPDCSHLVHKIYTLAGLNYPYAESRHLYRGTGSFERVSRPQPGDLIVWLGHVGIVVSPGQQTFFSSVRSGIITEPWTTDSWKMRGRPRFFRYRVGPATDQVLLANLSPPQSENDDFSTSTRSPDDTYFPPSQQPRKVFSATPSPTQSQYSENEPESPSSVAIIRQRAKPTKQDIAAALSQNGRTCAQKLIAGQFLDLEHPVSVVERFEVKKVKIKHESGTITLKLSETLSLDNGKIVTGKTVERKLGLHRQNGAWVISDPEERLYLPQGQALSVFERQAELFLQQTPDGNNTRTVIKALDVLFDREPAGAERAAMK